MLNVPCDAKELRTVYTLTENKLLLYCDSAMLTSILVIQCYLVQLASSIHLASSRACHRPTNHQHYHLIICPF